MTEQPVPVVQATHYSVNCVPESVESSYAWAVQVEYRGRDLWAVKHFGDCLGRDGQWSHEPSPSNRDEGWTESHRFDLDTALRLACEVAPTMTVNGWTPAAVIEKEAFQR